MNLRHGSAGRCRDDVRMDEFATYPSGLRLTGRRVVVVGGGHVAQRRVPQLIAAGADVHVVSPEVTPAIEGMVGSGEVTWLRARLRGRRPRRRLVRHRGHRRPRGQRAGRRPRPRSAGSSASAPTTPPRRPRGPRRSGGTPGSPSRCSATGEPAPLRGACATRSWRGCARARSSRRHERDRTPGVVAGRRRPGRPRADLGRRPQGADGGRRRGRRPAGARASCSASCPPTWS